MAKRARPKRRRANEITPAPMAEVRAPAPSIDRRHRWIARGLIALGALLAFGRALPYPILDGWDDDRFLLENPLVKEVSLAHLGRILGELHFEAYQPLHLLSYWLDVPWAGTSGPAIHATSLALFILALWALLEAVWALGLGFAGGLTCALIVGLHPVQVEAVVWATGRKDVLALGFSALALLFHARSARVWDRDAFLSLLAYAAACLSKTSALPLPVVMIAADLFLLERSWRSALLRQAPALLSASVLVAVTVGIWEEAALVRESAHPVALVCATLTHQLGTVIFPGSLSPLYPIERGEGFSWIAITIGPLVVVAAALFAWRAKQRTLAFGLVAFLALFAPTSNVIPLYFQWHDRYLSLALVPLAFLVGALVDHAPAKRALPVVAALALLLAARSAHYTGVWSDRVALFGHAAATHPRSFYAWLNLGHARRDRGDLEGAIRAYERASQAHNLALAHDSRFRAVVLLDERERGLAPSRADELGGRYHAVLTDADGLRSLAGVLAEGGYRRAVMLTLDQAFVLDPVADPLIEQAALVQLRRGHPWLSDYYVSRLREPPRTPALRERAGLDAEEPVNDP